MKTVFLSRKGKSVKKRRTRKGIYYFPTFESAREYAIKNGYPTDRIINYEIGWAIQKSISGDYVGPETVKGNPMKKKRSPAQLANDKRLGALAKKRAGKKSPRYDNNPLASTGSFAGKAYEIRYPDNEKQGNNHSLFLKQRGEIVKEFHDLSFAVAYKRGVNWINSKSRNGGYDNNPKRRLFKKSAVSELSAAWGAEYNNLTTPEKNALLRDFQAAIRTEGLTESEMAQEYVRRIYRGNLKSYVKTLTAKPRRKNPAMSIRKGSKLKNGARVLAYDSATDKVLAEWHNGEFVVWTVDPHDLSTYHGHYFKSLTAATKKFGELIGDPLENPARRSSRGKTKLYNIFVHAPTGGGSMGKTFFLGERAGNTISYTPGERNLAWRFMNARDAKQKLLALLNHTTFGNNAKNLRWTTGVVSDDTTVSEIEAKIAGK